MSNPENTQEVPEFLLNWAPDAPKGGKAVMNRVLKDGHQCGGSPALERGPHWSSPAPESRALSGCGPHPRDWHDEGSGRGVQGDEPRCLKCWPSI